MATTSPGNISYPTNADPQKTIEQRIQETAQSVQSALNYYPLSPNYVINGGFDIWQRGNSFSGNVYCADRWYGGNNPSAISRSTDVQSGFNYSLDITGANHLLGHRIEAAEASKLTGKTITLSFYAKSLSGTNSMTAAIGTPSSTDNFAISNIEYTSSAIAITSSWARYSVTFSALSANISKGLFIYLYRNGSTSTDRTLITGVQLEEGSVATPFRRNANSIQGELAACQRYCYVKNGSTSDAMWGWGRWESNSVYATLQHPVKMRTVPSFTLNTPSGLQAVDPTVAWYNVTAISAVHKNGTYASDVLFTTSGASVTNKTFSILAVNSGTPQLIVNAEL